MKSTLVKKLDKLWAKAIKERDIYCQKHIGKQYSTRMNAHHIIFRSKGNILRWDVINGVLLCSMPCHKFHNGSAHMDNQDFNDWFAMCNPSKWKYLQERKNKRVQFKDFHYEIIKDALETLTPLADVEGL